MRSIEEQPNLPWAREWYYRGRKVLLDPKKFMGVGDVGYIITFRDSSLTELTRSWCEKNVPGLEVIHIPAFTKTGSDTFRDWCKDAALRKAKLINELGLDIYFEDVPLIVRDLRVLCPETKIIQFGHDDYEGLT